MAWREVKKIQGAAGTFTLVKTGEDVHRQEHYMLDDLMWRYNPQKEEDINLSDYEVVNDIVFPTSLKYSSKILDFPHVIIQGNHLYFNKPNQEIVDHDTCLFLYMPTMCEDGIYVCYTNEFEFSPNNHLHLSSKAQNYYHRFLLHEAINLVEQFKNSGNLLYNGEVLNKMQFNVRNAIRGGDQQMINKAKDEVHQFNKLLKLFLEQKNGLHEYIYKIVKNV